MNQALISARGFYFLMYILFYLSVYLYPNQLRKSESFIYPILYYAIHLTALYLFLVAGKNPGFVNETDTPQSRRDKARMFVQGSYDEFRDVKDDVE